MFVSYWHLFISIGNLSWIEVNFFKPVSMYAIMSGRFLIWHFFEWVNPGVFSHLVLLRVLTLFPFCLSVPLFYVLIVSIFCSKIVLFPCHTVVGMCWCIHSLLSDRIFLSLFWNILLCLYCFILSRYLFSLPSFANTFWLFPQVVPFVLLVKFIFFFSSQVVSAFSLYFTFFACCRFPISVSGRISHPGFEFLFVFILGNTDFIRD